MPEEFVLYQLPSEVWAVAFSNLFGDRVVELVGTEHAARQTAEHYEAGAAVLFRSRTDPNRSVPKQGASPLRGAACRPQVAALPVMAPQSSLSSSRAGE
jgi:hypothetical protein